MHAFASIEPRDISLRVPRKVKGKLLFVASLAPMLGADLARDYIPAIVARNARPEYGFGVSFAPAPQEVLRELGHLAERRGDVVRCGRHRDDDAEPETQRLGIPRQLALRRCDFSHVLSMRSRKIMRSEILELQGHPIAG